MTPNHPRRTLTRDTDGRRSSRPASQRLARTALRTGSLINAVLLAQLITGCSGPGEDVRVTLCKDLVRGQLGGAAPAWTDVGTRAKGYEDAVISLRWSGPQGEGSARCDYPYNAVDDTAQQLADPLSAYAASPTKVEINGQSLTGPALASAIARAMEQQGRQLLDSAGKLLQQ